MSLFSLQYENLNSLNLYLHVLLLLVDKTVLKCAFYSNISRFLSRIKQSKTVGKCLQFYLTYFRLTGISQMGSKYLYSIHTYTVISPSSLQLSFHPLPVFDKEELTEAPFWQRILCFLCQPAPHPSCFKVKLKRGVVFIDLWEMFISTYWRAPLSVPWFFFSSSCNLSSVFYYGQEHSSSLF